MTNKKLIHDIIDLYEKAREAKSPAKNITRVKSHTISSEVEDLIAYFFSELTDEEIFIEKLFSFQLNEKKKSIRPDIVIKKENVITNFFDVKMDLGWKRSKFVDYCIEKSEIIKQIRGRKVDLSENIVSLSDKLKYEIIVISEKNISEKLLKENMERIAQANVNNEVPIYFLTNKVHPNHGDSQFARDNIGINDEQLNKLRDKIKMI